MGQAIDPRLCRLTNPTITAKSNPQAALLKLLFL